MTSYRVSEFARFKHAVFYKVECDCMENDHTLTVELEYDEELNMLFMNVYGKFLASIYGNFHPFWMSKKLGNMYNRIKFAIKMLMYGYIDGEYMLVMQGREHIQNFINALEEGKKHVVKVLPDDFGHIWILNQTITAGMYICSRCDVDSDMPEANQPCKGVKK